MTANARKLLLDIARCPNFCAAVTDKTHPCNKIATNKDQPVNRHLPEPWCGDIEKAEVLFISSNPSINPNEPFPNANWNNNKIVDFFLNRFDNKNYNNRYFSSVLKYAHWILNNINTKPTKDEKETLKKSIVITEVVHCKSKREYGVSEACQICVDSWLDKVLSLYERKYIVVLGAYAKSFLEKSKYLQNRRVVYLPHPNARGVKDEDRKEKIKYILK